jgi:hypothetical protein
MSTLTQCSAGIPSQGNKTGEKNKVDSHREGRRQIIPICRRRYDFIPEIP